MRTLERGWAVPLLLVALLAPLPLSCEDDVAGPAPTPESPLLSVNQWYPASPPIAPDADYPPGAIATEREPVRWYRPELEHEARRRDFDPTLDERENLLVPTLIIEIDSAPDDSLKWTGIMRGFAGSAPVWSRSGSGPLDLSHATHLSIWINDYRPDPVDRGGTLYIELGFIDEDFYRPAEDSFDLEDSNYDGFAAAFDDTGLDGVFGADGDAIPGDDGTDDHSLLRVNGVYAGINGTEMNNLNDTEDLDGSGALEEIDGYFRYRIELASSAEVDIRRDYPAYDDLKHPDDAWRRYRVPLMDYEAVTPDGVIPQLREIHHARIWFNRMDQVLNPAELRIQVARLAGVN